MTTAANPLVVACLQSEGVPGDVDANISALDDHAAQASTSGAHLLITDEMFVSGYDCGAIEHVVDDSTVTERLREIARRHRIALLVGMPERLPPAGSATARCSSAMTAKGWPVTRNPTSTGASTRTVSRQATGRSPWSTTGASAWRS
ncbi:nitrilase-related carbon-nitrogen hydrolase [Mycolicibacterium mageritense]|uniref:nitrilase-related carbon-nitrogen hydrolase n=1 Tax=Mycolicibacterium mageritense TaxID=53462 RepID=UPI0034D50743